MELKAMQVLAGGSNTFLHLPMFPVGMIGYVTSLRLEIGVYKVELMLIGHHAMNLRLDWRQARYCPISLMR